MDFAFGRITWPTSHEMLDAPEFCVGAAEDDGNVGALMGVRLEFLPGLILAFDQVEVGKFARSCDGAEISAAADLMRDDPFACVKSERAVWRQNVGSSSRSAGALRNVGGRSRHSY